MKWTFIDPDFIDKNIFGINHKVIACKVAKWHVKYDIRSYHLKGWKTFGELSEIDPRTEEILKKSKWFIYACKAQYE